MLRLPHCLDNRLTDGGEVKSTDKSSLVGYSTAVITLTMSVSISDFLIKIYSVAMVMKRKMELK
jgi:hypothetical protein